MNSFMVRRLVAKDWYFLRWALLAYAIGGGTCLWVIVQPWKLAFAVGSIGLVSIVMTMAAHMAISVVEERSNQTLTFLMGLPISAVEYSTSKLVSSLGLFLGPWLVLVGGATLLILAHPGVPDGLLPFAILVLVELLVAYGLAVGIALVTESMGWTIATFVITNLGFQGWLYFVGHVPGVAEHIEGPRVVWNGTSLGLLAVEIAVFAAILLGTVFLQSRKRDFL